MTEPSTEREALLTNRLQLLPRDVLKLIGDQTRNKTTWSLDLFTFKHGVWLEGWIQSGDLRVQISTMIHATDALSEPTGDIDIKETAFMHPYHSIETVSSLKSMGLKEFGVLLQEPEAVIVTILHHKNLLIARNIEGHRCLCWGGMNVEITDKAFFRRCFDIIHALSVMKEIMPKAFTSSDLITNTQMRVFYAELSHRQ